MMLAPSTVILPPHASYQVLTVKLHSVTRLLGAAAASSHDESTEPSSDQRPTPGHLFALLECSGFQVSARAA